MKISDGILTTDLDEKLGFIRLRQRLRDTRICVMRVWHVITTMHVICLFVAKRSVSKL